MGRKLANAGATKRACALVSAARCESRFCIMPSHGMHANRDGDRDRPADVTAESSDVSDRRQRLEGRGLTCRSAPTRHSTHSTTNRHDSTSSAVLCAQKSERRRQFIRTTFLQAARVDQVKRSCEASSKKRVDKIKENLEDVNTWRASRWAKMEASKGSKSKRKLIIEVVGNERLRILLDSSC